MKTVPLGEVALIERAGVDPERLDAATPYLGLEHIERGGRIIGRSTVGESELASTKFRFSELHVLYGKLRPNLGKVSRPDFAGVCSTDILPIRPGPEIDRAYLHRYLSQPVMVEFAASRTSGANLPRLSPTVLATFPVPLPRMEEQRRIAAILDQADAVRAKRRQVLTHLDGLASSTFRRALAASPGRLMRLGEVADFFGGSSLPEGEPFAGQHGGALLMRVSDMNTVGNEQEILSTASWAQHGSSRASTVSEGAVVLPKRGASISTNKKRLTTRPAALDPNIMGVAPRPELITSTYLFAWFQRLDLSTLVSGSSVPQLNKKDLSPLVIPVPSLEDQRAFGSVVAGLNSVRAATTRGMADNERLFSALQARAFRGEL